MHAVLPQEGFAMAGKVNDEVAQLRLGNLHLENLNQLAILKCQKEGLPNARGLQFFFVILNYLFPLGIAGPQFQRPTRYLYIPPLVATLGFQLERLEPGGTPLCSRTLCND